MKAVNKGVFPIRKMVVEAKIGACGTMIEELGDDPYYKNEVKQLRLKRIKLISEFLSFSNK